MVDILIVDDHALFRIGLSTVLKTFDDINEVYEAANGVEALDIMQEKKVDIILLDLYMPVMDGIETAKLLINDYPDTSIIILSINDSLKTIVDLIDIGVHGYMLKDTQPERIRDAIKSVIKGDFFYNSIVAKALHTKIKEETENTSIEKEKPIITPREVEVVQMICLEMSMVEIADKLNVSMRTIQTHRKNIMRKIDVHNTVGIVKFAIQHDIVSFT